MRRSIAKNWEAIAGYLFISPWWIGFLIFTVGPLLASFALSFTEWNLIKPPQFVGLQNYIDLLKDELFWQALKVTTIYSLGRVPLGIIIGLAAALLLNQKVRLQSFWRVVYYMPVVLPAVAVSMLWLWIFNPQYGVLNGLLWDLFRIQGPAWIQDETWVLPSLMMMAVWGMLGRNMIVYLSGLNSIAGDLYVHVQVETPVKLTVEVVSSDMADRAMLMPGVTREGLKLTFVSEDMPRAYASFRALVLLCYPR